VCSFSKPKTPPRPPPPPPPLPPVEVEFGEQKTAAKKKKLRGATPLQIPLNNNTASKAGLGGI